MLNENQLACLFAAAMAGGTAETTERFLALAEAAAATMTSDQLLGAKLSAVEIMDQLPTLAGSVH